MQYFDNTHLSNNFFGEIKFKLKLQGIVKIRGLSQKFVDTRCFHLIFDIYKSCCISTERLIITDFIDTK